MSHYQWSNSPTLWRVRCVDGQEPVVKAFKVTTNACGALVFSDGVGQVVRMFAPALRLVVDTLFASTPG